LNPAFISEFRSSNQPIEQGAAAAFVHVPLVFFARFLPSGRRAGLVPARKAAKKAAAKGRNMSYRLVTYAAAAGPRAGVVIGDEVFDAAKLRRRPEIDESGRVVMSGGDSRRA
jgi:hypothetical protein